MFFLMMRTLRVYSPNNSHVYHIAVLTIVMLYIIYIVLIYHINENILPPFSNSSSSHLHKSVFFFLWVCCMVCMCVCVSVQVCMQVCFRFYTWVRSYNIFFVSLVLLSIMSSGSIHIIANGRVSFFFGMAE